MQLVANLLEGLLSTCFTIPTSSTSADTTNSGVTASVPATPAPVLKRTVSVTSSSGLDQVKSEVAESVSSTAFSQIQQVWHHNKTFKNFARCLVAFIKTRLYLRFQLFSHHAESSDQKNYIVVT